MNSKRISQLREFSKIIGWKDDVWFMVWSVNNDILEQDEEKIIEKYIQAYIRNAVINKNFTIENFKILISKIKLVLWINLKDNISLNKIFYSIIVENILLPDYYTWDNPEEEIKDFTLLINSNLEKLNREMLKIWNQKINLNIWNKEDFFDQIFEQMWDINWPDVSSLIPLRNMEINKELERIYLYYDNSLWLYTIWIVLDWKNKNNKFSRFLTERNIWPIAREIKDEYDEKYNLDTLLGIQTIKENWKTQNSIFLNIRDYNSYIEDWYINAEKFLIHIEKILKFWEYFTNRLVENLEIEIENNILFFLSNWDLLITPTKEEKQEFEIDFNRQFWWRDENYEKSELTESEIEKFIVKDTQISLNDIWWNTDAKIEISKIINSIKFEEIMKEWWAKTTTWIIFEWPSGTWKTMLAKVIAHEIDAIVFNIKLTDIASDAYINTWSKNIKQIFEYIRKKHKTTWKKIILILDELDALFKKRWQDWSREDTKIVNEFLTQMDWFDDNSWLIIIWTTNRYDDLDQAVIRSWRISKKVSIPLPNEEDRKQIFWLYIEKAKLWREKVIKAFTDIDLDILAKNSSWLSWADIKEIIREIIQDRAIEEASAWYFKFIYTKNILEEIEKFKKSKLQEESRRIWF